MPDGYGLGGGLTKYQEDDGYSNSGNYYALHGISPEK